MSDSIPSSLSEVTLPGVPIDETLFASLIDDEYNQVTFRGNFEQISTRPYILKYSPLANATIISAEKAYESANDSIEEPYQNLLDTFDWATLNPNLPEWTFRLAKYPDDLVVVVSVHAHTGAVVSYHHHWDGGLNPRMKLYSPPLLNENGSLGSQGQVESKLVEFMEARGYYLPENTRLMKSDFVPTDHNTSYYEIEMAIPKGLVLTDEFYQGILARVDALTGEVWDFKYKYIEIPLINETGFIDPTTALSNAIASDYPSAVGDELESTFLRMHMSDMRFQLVWSFRLLSSSSVHDDWPYEIHRDVFDGNAPISSESGQFYDNWVPWSPDEGYSTTTTTSSGSPDFLSQILIVILTGVSVLAIALLLMMHRGSK